MVGCSGVQSGAGRERERERESKADSMIECNGGEIEVKQREDQDTGWVQANGERANGPIAASDSTMEITKPR